MTASRPVVVSGIRPTGRLHLGNLLGAVQNYIELQERGDCFYFIADLHALTTGFPARAEILANRQDIVLDFLAAGVDPERACIYVQSAVPEIPALASVLACLAAVNTVMGMHHFADKRERLGELGRSANLGLLSYPVLMAADILAQKGDLVPVGDDQKQHLELARDLARLANQELDAAVFPVPEPVFAKTKRVPGLDVNGKMSKSCENSVIYLADGADAVRAKFRRAVTDTARARRTDPGEPNRCPAYRFHELLCSPEEQARAQAGCRNATIGCIECKSLPAERINGLLGPIQERRREFAAKGPAYVEELLAEGTAQARRRAAATYAEVLDRLGLRLAPQAK